MAFAEQEAAMRKPTLLPGYRLEEDSEFAYLMAPNGHEVSVFTLSADAREIERECFEHAAKVDAALGLVKRLLEQRESS